MTGSICANTHKISKPALIQGLCFALCFFAFQLAEFTVNDKAAYIVGSSAVNTIYSIGIACTAMGFLSFSLVRKYFQNDRARQCFIFFIGVLSIFFTFQLLFAKTQLMFLCSSFLLLLFLGHISGCVYYNTAMFFDGNDYTGRVIGIGMGCAVVMQFIVQNLLVTDAAFLLSMVLSVAVLLYIIVKPSHDWILENPLPYSSENKTDRKKASTLIAAVIIMSLIIGLIDGVVVSKHAVGELSVSFYSRLFYAGSLVIAGFISDIDNRKFLPLATVCMMFFSTISTAFMSSPATFFMGMASMYIYSGFYVMFLTLSFFDFAPKTKAPTLWAGMGRICRSFVIALTAVPVLRLFDTYGSISLVVMSCVLSILVLLILLKDIISAMYVEKDAPALEEPISKEDALRLYCEHYGLTPRETEVFEKLIITENGNQEIADELFVSRRVLQRHVASIYEKTGTKNRIGLYQSYSDFTANKFR